VIEFDNYFNHTYAQIHVGSPKGESNMAMYGFGSGIALMALGGKFPFSFAGLDIENSPPALQGIHYWQWSLLYHFGSHWLRGLRLLKAH